MISKRVSLSRDLYAAGLATLGASGVTVLFTPLNMPTGSVPTVPPTAEDGESVPGGTLPAIFADRVFVSNPSAHVIYLRPVVPGSPEAPEYPYPAFAGALGGSGANAKWIGFNPAGFAAAPTALTGISIPAGAVAFPIEVVCIGLVLGGTLADTLTYAAYGSPKRT